MTAVSVAHAGGIAICRTIASLLGLDQVFAEALTLLPLLPTRRVVGAVSLSLLRRIVTVYILVERECCFRVSDGAASTSMLIQPDLSHALRTFFESTEIDINDFGFAMFKSELAFYSRR